VNTFAEMLCGFESWAVVLYRARLTTETVRLELFSCTARSVHRLVTWLHLTLPGTPSLLERRTSRVALFNVSAVQLLLNNSRMMTERCG
jgi:hypothetical protein